MLPSQCTETNMHSRHVQVKGVTDQGLKARPMKVVAVLGGGLMGSGICTALASAGIDVLLKDISQKFVDAGLSASPPTWTPVSRRKRWRGLPQMLPRPESEAP